MATAAEILAAAQADPANAREAALAAAARLPGAAQAADLDRVDATIAYRAQDGDTLDSIAHRRYGSVAAVRWVLAANPDLTTAAPRLVAGTLVALPDIDSPEEGERPVVQIWD